MKRREFLKLVGSLPFVPFVPCIKIRGENKKKKRGLVLVPVLQCNMKMDANIVDGTAFNIREMEEKKYIRQMLKELFLSDKRLVYVPIQVMCKDLGKIDGGYKTEMLLYCLYKKPMRSAGYIDWAHRDGRITKVAYDFSVRSNNQ